MRFAPALALVVCAASPAISGCRDAAPTDASTPSHAAVEPASDASTSPALNTTTGPSSPDDGDGDGDPDPEGARDPEALLDSEPPAAGRPRGLESGPASPELVAQARKIQRDLECIRGRRFKKDVGVEFQSLEDFEAFMDRQLAKEMAGGKDLRAQRMLHALGLMHRDVVFMDVMRKATLEQAAAYYDPDTDTFYVVQSMPALALRAVMAHELQHALQDQHTKLLDRYTAGDFDTFDQELAVRFLVEGEATLVGHAWTMAHVGDQSLLLGSLLPKVCYLPGEAPGDPEVFWSAMQDLLVSTSEQTRQEIQDPGLFAKLATRAMSESMYASMQGLRELPNFVFYSLLLPYNFGGFTVFTVFQQARYDWKSVDTLFERPPETTEQVLHPHKLRPRGNESFVRPKLPRVTQTGPHTEGWTFDPQDRVGELGIRIWFIERGATERQAAMLAEGWNGDTVRVWWRPDPDGPPGEQRLAYEWKLRWDQPSYAQRFRVAFAKALPDQHPNLRFIEHEQAALDQTAKSGEARYVWTDPAGQTRHGKLEWSGTEVTVSQGWLTRF